MSSITGMGFSTYTNHQTQRANTEHNQTSVTTNLVSEKSDVSLSDARSNSGSESIKKSGDFLAEVESAIRNSHSESGLSGSELNKETVKAYSLPLWLSSYTAGSIYNNNVGVSLDNGLYTVSDPIKNGKVEWVYNLPDDQRERYNDLVVSHYYSALRQTGIKTPDDYVNYLNTDNRTSQILIEEVMNNLMKDDSELMSLIKTAKNLT
ncbi:hypothetical protein [Nitrincola sp. MINF-07-Sa-05]|uniref:hypothetical protein n=1 Tax=Nitrincola salilacus TaxID=3400273 RepID=UPI003917ED05